MQKIGIVGAGAMGTGIAQVAAQAGMDVCVYDLVQSSLDRANQQLQSTMEKLIEKGKLTSEQSQAILGRISFSTDLHALADKEMVIEAIVEDLQIKKSLFIALEEVVSQNCVLASNTSSLSITALAATCRHSSRVIGLHFFNPAPIMPLVEIIPALQSSTKLSDQLTRLMHEWKKTPVLAKDTPGFIVNRIARPFYSESLRILEEGLASISQIDAAMRHIGFKMGPFELMDLIGNDVNYNVTKSVFEMLYFDPRYKPSLTQLKHVEAGWYGRKTNRGFYNYSATVEQSNHDIRYDFVHERVLTLLINEAYDALYHNIANAADLDLSVTKGVNYPKGLIAWGEELGLDQVRIRMQALYDHYQEDRYRCSPGLRNRLH